jgi:hypothetical protein
VQPQQKQQNLGLKKGEGIANLCLAIGLLDVKFVIILKK